MDRHGRGHAELDPARHPARWEALVGGILQAAGPELERRRDEAGLMATLASWARPALSAAATVALLLSASVALTRSGASASAEPLLASALVPEEVAAWLMAGYQPTVTEVVVALEEVVR